MSDDNRLFMNLPFLNFEFLLSTTIHDPSPVTASSICHGNRNDVPVSSFIWHLCTGSTERYSVLTIIYEKKKTNYFGELSDYFRRGENKIAAAAYN